MMLYILLSVVLRLELFGGHRFCQMKVDVACLRSRVSCACVPGNDADLLENKELARYNLFKLWREWVILEIWFCFQCWKNYENQSRLTKLTHEFWWLHLYCYTVKYVTCWRCGWEYRMSFIGNLTVFLAVREFWKCLKFDNLLTECLTFSLCP